VRVRLSSTWVTYGEHISAGPNFAFPRFLLAERIMRTEPPLKTDKATLAVEALPEGKISVRTAAWEEAQIILKDEVLDLRNMDAAFASPGRRASTTTTTSRPRSMTPMGRAARPTTSPRGVTRFMSGETRFIHTEASKALRLKRVTLIAVTRLGTAKELPNAQKYNAPRYCRVGLTFGYGRALMHGVAPRMCGQVSLSTVRRGSRESLPRRPLACA